MLPPITAERAGRSAASTLASVIFLTACVSQTNFAFFSEASSTLTADAVVIPADGNTRANLALRLMATEDRPAIGWTVRFATQAPDTTVWQDSDSTDANGMLTGHVTTNAAQGVNIQVVATGRGKSMLLPLAVRIVAAPPARIAALSLSSDTPVAGDPVTATARVLDANRLPVLVYVGTMALQTTDPQTSPVTFAFDADNQGRAVAQNITFTTVGSQTVTLTTTSGPPLASDRADILVSPIPTATRLVLSGYGTPRAAGQNGNLIITAIDANNAVDTRYTGTVRLTASDPEAQMNAQFTFLRSYAGSAQLPVTLKTAGVQSLSANDTATPSVAGRLDNINVHPDDANRYRVAGFPATVVAGAQGNVIVQVQDAFGNPVTAYTGTCRVGSSDPNAVLPGDMAFSGGPNLTLPLSLVTAGMQNITVRDIATPSIYGVEQNINTVHDVADNLRVATATATTAGRNEDLWITAFDRSANVVTDYNATVTFTATDADALLPGPSGFSAMDDGNKRFSAGVVWYRAGTQAVTVTSSDGLVATSAPVTVAAASPNRIAVDLPTRATAGVALSPNVSVMDNWNNLVTAFAGSVTFSNTDVAGATVTPATTTFSGTDGGHKVLTGALTFTTSGNQTLSATVASPSIAGAATVNVSGSNAVRLALSGPSTVPAGQPFALRVTAMDDYNNVSSTYAGSVTYTANDYQAFITPWTYTFTTADAGTTQNTNVMLATAGPRIIRAVGNTPGSPNGTLAVTVVPGPLSKLQFGPLFWVTAGTDFSTTLSGADVYGNLISSYTGSVQVASTDPMGVPAQGAPQTVTVSAGGTATLSHLSFRAPDYQALTATDAGNNLSGQQNYVVHPLMTFSNGQNANSLHDYSHVGNNAGNPYYDPAGRLMHADSYFGTFAIWNSLPTDDVVADSAWTFDGAANANYVAYPHQVIADGNNGVFIVDEVANRLMHWHTTPLTKQPANSVIGQADFSGTGGACDTNRLNRPTDAIVVPNANALIVADCGNSRILVYSPIPYISNPSATLALGSPSLDVCPANFSASPNAFSSFCPVAYGLWSDGQHLAFADAAASRVVIFNDLPGLLRNGANAPNADVVIGQADMYSANAANPPTMSSLNKPTGITSDGTQLFIVDALDARVLVYPAIPTANNPNAVSVLGQPDFISNGTGSGPAQLNLPLSVMIAQKELLVGDHQNTRYQLFFGQ